MVTAVNKVRKTRKARPVTREDLRCIDQGEAAIRQLLHDPRFMQWFAEIYRIGLRPLASQRPEGDLLILELRCPGGNVSIAFTPELLPVVSLAIEATSTFKLPIASLTASQVLAPVLEEFGVAAADAGDKRWHAIGIMSATLLDAGETRALPIPIAAFALTTQTKITTDIFILSAAPACVGFLDEMVCNRPVLQHPMMHSWEIPSVVRIATRSWTAAMLRLLEIGDVMLIREAATLQAVHATLFCGSLTGIHWKVNVEINYRKVTMTGKVEMEGGMLNDHTELAGPPLDAAVAQLEVPVHFEIDNVPLPLAQVASLRPGYVIDLAIPVDQAEIRLLACGQLIGRGKLVVIGECLGVQISHLTTGSK